MISNEARSHDHRHIALERNAEQSLQDDRHQQHDDEEDAEQRRELAGECHNRVAARASEPGAHAAAVELGAYRIAGGDRDDHVHHHRQQRAQQKLCVVPLRIDQHDGLSDERADARRFRRRALGRALGGCGEAVAQTRRRDARGGEELLVIEADHLRASPGLQIALEIGRHINGGDCLAGAYRPRRRTEVPGALGNAEPGRRLHFFHEGPRGFRSVGIDDDHPELADHRVAEHCGQHREGEQRNAEDQDQRRAVVQQPPAFASCDQAGTRVSASASSAGPHRRVRQSR